MYYYKVAHNDDDKSLLLTKTTHLTKISKQITKYDHWIVSHFESTSCNIDRACMTIERIKGWFQSWEHAGTHPTQNLTTVGKKNGHSIHEKKMEFLEGTRHRRINLRFEFRPPLTRRRRLFLCFSMTLDLDRHREYSHVGTIVWSVFV